MIDYTQGGPASGFIRRLFSINALTIGILVFLPALSSAQNYEFGINSVGKAVPIEQADPDYPGGSVRSGQEGWVRMSFVVTADGRSIDPIIVDSSGGAGFESAAREALEEWRFEPPPSGVELPANMVDIRSELFGGRDAATSNFMRRTRHILLELHNEENESARKQVDLATKLGGWNLYESTMLWLMVGRVEGAEGDMAGKLESYQRSLAMGNSKSIPNDDRIDLLEKIFTLQFEFNQHAAAERTARSLKQLDDSKEAAARIADPLKTVKKALANDALLAAQATITNPCDCDAGEPLWSYAPARRTFSFANITGNVERFEARCSSKRIGGAVDADSHWTLEPEWGNCRVFVFGDDESSFDFVEHKSAQ